MHGALHEVVCVCVPGPRARGKACVPAAAARSNVRILLHGGSVARPVPWLSAARSSRPAGGALARAPRWSAGLVPLPPIQ